MTTNNKQLRDLAEKATPGEWTTDGGVTVVAAGSDQLNNGYAISECHGPESAQNVDFIAAASPATILKLLNSCEALQAECKQLRKDAARLDWLADMSNPNGHVMLPTECVEMNMGDMRAAIDAAMRMERA